MTRRLETITYSIVGDNVLSVCAVASRVKCEYLHIKNAFSLWLTLINLDGNCMTRRLDAFYLLLKSMLLVAGNANNEERRTGSDVRRRHVCWSDAVADYWPRGHHERQIDVAALVTWIWRQTEAGNWIKCSVAVPESSRFVTDNILRLWFSAAIGPRFTVRVFLWEYCAPIAKCWRCGGIISREQQWRAFRWRFTLQLLNGHNCAA